MTEQSYANAPHCKLKTLKGIKFEIPGNKTENSLGNKYIKSLLREEAIKWIKKSDYDLYEKFNFEDGPNEMLRRWIKHFFNIEESDLK